MSWREKPPAIAEREIGQTYTADVIVVGLGYAGTAALRAAAEQGASVIGLEILSEKAYHTFGRDVGHINSRFLKSRGIPPVDELEFFNEWMAR